MVRLAKGSIGFGANEVIAGSVTASSSADATATPAVDDMTEETPGVPEMISKLDTLINIMLQQQGGEGAEVAPATPGEEEFEVIDDENGAAPAAAPAAPAAAPAPAMQEEEIEIEDFEGDEKAEMRAMLQADQAHDDGINTLITKSYTLLGLETYFTTGEVETRAWTIAKNSTAPVAAAAIHTDFQTKFIRAEAVFWSDLLNAGSFANAKAQGLVRTEGKEYIVKDGDVLEFKI